MNGMNIENKFVKEAKRRMAAEKARNMRYKKPMLASLGWSEIENRLNDIEEECASVHYFTDDESDSLVAALDGDEDEAYEFRMTFADIEAKCDNLRRVIGELSYDEDTYDYFEDFFNTCTVALLGNRYDVVGFDTYEEDYMSMARYEQDLATTEAGKKLMRMTKAEMISCIGQCFGIVLSFADLENQYQSISAAMAVLRSENITIIGTIKEIEAAFNRCEEYYNDPEYKRLIKCLPDRVWLE